MLKLCLFVVIALVHAALVLTAPEALAPLAAATVYLPLWPMGALGLPVFAAAASGGWAAPSVLGWLVVGVVWAAVWWAVASLGTWALQRSTSRG